MYFCYRRQCKPQKSLNKPHGNTINIFILPTHERKRANICLLCPLYAACAGAVYVVGE